MKNFIIIFGIWFLCGVISILLWTFRDLRGEEYREDYIDEDIVMAYFLMILGGVPSLFLSMMFCLIDLLVYNALITKLLYKIANIGIKKKEDKDGAATD